MLSPWRDAGRDDGDLIIAVADLHRHDFSFLLTDAEHERSFQSLAHGARGNDERTTAHLPSASAQSRTDPATGCLAIRELGAHTNRAGVRIDLIVDGGEFAFGEQHATVAVESADMRIRVTVASAPARDPAVLAAT